MHTATMAPPVGLAQRSFSVEGMHCSKCATSVDRAVSALDGVSNFNINAATGRAHVSFDSERTTLRTIYSAVERTGFKPLSLEGDEALESERLERRAALKRIGVAGLGMMQTMMFVYALYAGGEHGVDAGIAQYLRIAGMLLTTPVLVYSGAPFLQAAWKDLRRKRLGMDVPVATALLLAFAASAVNTFRGDGQVYYDSVTMFIFLLSIGRFAEMAVRQRSLSAGEALARSVPAFAVRLRPDGTSERIRSNAVRVGDLILIARGAIVPVDGKLASGAAHLDESLVTGESLPVKKDRGANVLGGSINTSHPIEIVCTSAAADSTLSGIVTLLRKAAAERPKSVAAADRAASFFSLSTLVLAAAVAICWAFVNPSNVMPATLAVLVVTCPCALSLATPAAFAAATTRLARWGLLVVRGGAIEALARIDTVVLDKTGTLTNRQPAAKVVAVRAGLSEQQALKIAAALEQGSDHPLAQAFVGFADAAVRAVNAQEDPGRGVQAAIDGHTWRIGSPDYARGARTPLAYANGVASGSGDADDLSAQQSAPSLGTVIYLADSTGIAAHFKITDSLSPQATTAVTNLRRDGIQVALASGDAPEPVLQVARDLGLDNDVHARMDFSQKLNFVRDLQSRGKHVLMVGDGINDGPVLAAADVSCAMSEGAAVAHSAADLLLMNGSLTSLSKALRLARQTQRVVRQNLAWALVYNLTMVPLAAAGLIAPWIAAAGMSASSLAVVLNSARLARGDPQ